MKQLRSFVATRLVGYLFLLHLTMILPGRIGLAHWKTRVGTSIWQDLLLGASIDSRHSFPYAALILGLSYFLWRRIYKIFPAKKILHRITDAMFLGSAWLLTVLFTLSNVAASEYKVQRGVYPVIHDILLADGDWGFIKANISTFWMDRYFVPLLICLCAQIFLMKQMARLVLTAEFKKRWQEGLGFTFLTMAAAALSFQCYIYSPKAFALNINREEIASPLKEITDSLTHTDPNALKKQLNSLYLSAEESLEQTKAGAQILGFPREHGEHVLKQEEINCNEHPLKRPLVENDIALLRDLSELSKVIFEGRKAPLQIWHLMIESFRANEIHALNQHAPEVITPTMNRLYQANNQSSREAVIRATNMQQGGLRTSQGISGTFCGMGALPLLASFSRDFGAVPARCMPDVLSDAGFENRLFYGSFLNFDNMKIFFQYHGFKTYEDLQMPKPMPKGVWGLADQGVAKYAWSTVEREASSSSQYNVFLTLSNHTPYRVPEDMPADVTERMEAWHATNKFSGNKEDWAHVLDVAYSDSVVDLFINNIEQSASAKDTILIAHADHATSDTPLWDDVLVHKNEDWIRKIPFVIYFPPAFKDGVKNKQRFVALLNRVNEGLQKQSSINDVPQMILALLAADPQMKSLPAEWRWHTLGGQATSKDFEIPTLTQTKVWGIDASSNAFFINEEGRQFDREPVSFLQSQQDPQWRKRHLMPVTSFLGAFLKGYGQECYEAKNIRRNVVTE